MRKGGWRSNMFGRQAQANKRYGRRGEQERTSKLQLQGENLVMNEI